MPVAAGGTRAAVVEGEHDAAADGYVGDACPCRGHHAGALVTQDQWWLRHEHVDAREQIGVAEPVPAISTSTSPGPGSASSTSSILKAPPRSRNTAAWICNRTPS